MEETHNYAMNLIVPLMGIAPLLMLFVLKGEKKAKRKKNWTRSINQKFFNLSKIITCLKAYAIPNI